MTEAKGQIIKKDGHMLQMKWVRGGGFRGDDSEKKSLSRQEGVVVYTH